MLSNKCCIYACGGQICLPKSAALCVMKLCVLEMAEQLLPVGNSEHTPCVALLARAALALPCQLFQNHPVSFLTSILLTVWSSCCRDENEGAAVWGLFAFWD